MQYACKFSATKTFALFTGYYLKMTLTIIIDTATKLSRDIALSIYNILPSLF